MTDVVEAGCEVCRTKLSGRQQKFCSPYCRNLAQRKALLAQRDAGKVELRCRRCNKVLDGRKTTWCSITCKRDHETDVTLIGSVETYARQCTKCKLVKPLAVDFYQTNNGNYRRACRTCVIAGNAERNARPDTADVKRNTHLRLLYGIDSAKYEELLQAQGGKCAVCRKPPIRRRLAVDHDHRSMKIRGLLCNYCNLRVIGKATDATLYRTAAEYLENPPADRVLDPDHRVPGRPPKKRRPPTRTSSTSRTSTRTRRKKATR